MLRPQTAQKTNCHHPCKQLTAHKTAVLQAGNSHGWHRVGARFPFQASVADTSGHSCAPTSIGIPGYGSMSETELRIFREVGGRAIMQDLFGLRQPRRPHSALCLCGYLQMDPPSVPGSLAAGSQNTKGFHALPKLRRCLF